MFGPLRYRVMAGAVLIGLAIRVLANPGYLPTVGPVSIRFLPPPQPVSNLVTMPLPPVMEQPVEEPAPVEVAVKTNVLMTPVAAPAADTNPPAAISQSPPPGGPPTSDPMISPQMLLKFFNRTTNGNSSGVIAPMEFAPPGTPPPPSSTATYSVTPPP